MYAAGLNDDRKKRLGTRRAVAESRAAGANAVLRASHGKTQRGTSDPELNSKRGETHPETNGPLIFLQYRYDTATRTALASDSSHGGKVMKETGTTVAF